MTKTQLKICNMLDWKFKIFIVISILTNACSPQNKKIVNSRHELPEIKNEYILESNCPNCSSNNLKELSYNELIYCNNCGIHCSEELKHGCSVLSGQKIKNKLYAVVNYDIQLRIDYGKPSIVGLYKTFEKAKEVQQNLKIQKWIEISKEGLKNDLYQFYKPFFIKEGIDLDNRLNLSQAKKLVRFIETGEVYYEQLNESQPIRYILETVKIFVIEDLDQSNSPDRTVGIYAHLEAVENLSNSNHNSGIPIIGFSSNNDTEILNQIELLIFKKKVLKGNFINNLDFNNYWINIVNFNQTMREELIVKLRQNSINSDSLKYFEDIRDIRMFSEEIAKTKFVRMTGSEKHKIK